MLKLLLFLSLFSTSLLARDCLKESWNFQVGMKLTFNINDLIDRYEERQDLSVCNDGVKNSIWKDEKVALAANYERMNKELKRKGVIPAQILDFGHSPETEALTHQELCLKLDKKLKEEETCYVPRSHIVELKETDFLSLNFKDACRKWLPGLYKSYRSCRSEKK